MGITAAPAQFCYINGRSLGDATALAPVDYIRIIMMAALGSLFLP
jgi:uncharacterized membrane protein